MPLQVATSNARICGEKWSEMRRSRDSIRSPLREQQVDGCLDGRSWPAPASGARPTRSVGLIAFCVSLAEAILENRHPRPQLEQRPGHRSRSLAHFRRWNAKTPAFRAGVLGLGSLTITYFHTGIRTIIGVESFHGPVRDGKGWDRLAMVIRQRGLSCWHGQQNQSWKKQ